MTTLPELTELRNKILKHQSGKRDELAVLDILEGLRSRECTLRQLADSKLSKAVAKLKKDKDEKIKKVALELIAKWKKMLATQAASKASGGSRKSTTPLSTGLTPSPKLSNGTKSRGFVKPGATSSTREGKITYTGVTLRDKVREALFKHLGAGEKSANAAIHIEDAMNVEFKGVTQSYKSFFRVIVSNIRDPDNEEIRKKILEREIEPSELVRMSASDLATESVRSAREKTIKDSQDAARSDWDKYSGATDQFTCFKCKKAMVKVTQVQIRSSDEPMTTKVLCVNCGNRWNC
eukprot:CAMPEP_0114510432 /NCGR_PEP_ID=MMETSP0109-20121206/13785_1 /TAXON_ID=29199 /ORGANISM="Chlorarachnion reptans, Strain CCCM449" /LENGTH=292 /DNA_ID=CAMNT_0001689741 /DNA_START=57 /DNA_END=935 /DNA_ORIENTATION=+